MKIISILILILPFIFHLKDVSAYENKNKTEILWNKGEISSLAYLSIKKDIYGENINFKNNSFNKIRINSYKEVRDIAIENIISTISKIKVNNNETIGELIKKNRLVQNELSQVLNNKIKTREYPEGFLTIKSIAKLKISYILNSIPAEYPEFDIPRKDEYKISTEYSSIIIDTRGLNINPMLFPSIYDEDGLEIYGKLFVKVNEAVKKGIVTYSYNEIDAKNNRLAGAKPFFTVAIKNLKGSPVISHKDLVKILSNNKTIMNLKKCNVIFIIDKPKRG